MADHRHLLHHVTAPDDGVTHATLGSRVALASAGSWVAVVVFAGVFGPWLPLHDPNEPLVGPPRSGPTLAHPFGTDAIGHDLLAQLVAGARTSLLVAGFAVLIGFAVGGTAGVAAGYLRGRTDRTIVWLTDVLLAFPGLVLALALVSFAGASLRSVIIAIAVGGVPIYARVARATTLVLAQEDFVTIAHMIGAKSRRIVFREIYPNVAVQLLAYSALSASVAVIAEGGLAFLGLGVPDQVSWGTMIAEGQSQLRDAPQTALSAVGVMFLTIVSLNHLGERLGMRIDPRESQMS